MKFFQFIYNILKFPESLPDPSTMTEAQKQEEIEELERRILELKPPKPQNNKTNYMGKMTKIFPPPKDVH